MQLPKDTGRWYDDACGTALALELTGERWSLLVMRELMFGPRRFGQIRHGLPGISAKVLTDRLGGLEASGVLVHHPADPPLRPASYELTPWGLASEPILQAMGRWAVQSPQHDPTLPLSPASLMMSLRTLVEPASWARPATIGFQLGADSFVARFDASGVSIVRAAIDGCDVVLIGTPETLAPIIHVGRPMAEAEAAGDLRIEGDRAVAGRLVAAFGGLARG